jgi:hypothetical protein
MVQNLHLGPNATRAQVVAGVRRLAEVNLLCEEIDHGHGQPGKCGDQTESDCVPGLPQNPGRQWHKGKRGREGKQRQYQPGRCPAGGAPANQRRRSPTPERTSRPRRKSRSVPPGPRLPRLQQFQRTRTNLPNVLETVPCFALLLIAMGSVQNADADFGVEVRFRNYVSRPAGHVP